MTYDSRKADYSREHIYVVEIDQPKCVNTFQTSPCLGGIWEISLSSSSGNWAVGDNISNTGGSGATGVITATSGANPTITLQYRVTNGIQFTGTETIDNDDDTGTGSKTGSAPTNESTGDQKCFNTLATCQDLVNYDDLNDTGSITINANISGTFTRTTGNYVTDGFQANDVITTSGFTNAGNNSTFIIDTLTTTVITVKDATGMVTETGNANEQVTAMNRQVYRFCEARSPHPIGIDAIPNIRSVRISPSKIDIKGGLGVRASASISFTDHVGTDIDIDPYLADRSYDPVSRGTYWTKFRARNASYENKSLRVLSGYLVDGEYDEVNFSIRYYVTDTLTATGGRANIKAKDPLKLAMSMKAVAPAVSTGKVATAITGASTDIDLDTGSGADYPTNGKVLIDKEVITYTGKTGDTLGSTSITRAQNGTTQADHSVDATVQLCLEYSSATVDSIVEDLLTNYATIDPVYIPSGTWSADVGLYISGLLNTLIVKPTDVNKLLKELAETAPHFLWWDERNQLIQLTPLRAPPESADLISSDANILADSFSTTDKPDMRVSTVIVNYGQINPTLKLDEFSNYEASFIRIDTESLQKYADVSAIKTVNSRWITTAGQAIAEKLAILIGRRFSEVPREMKFSLDPKDSGGEQGLWTGETRNITHRDLLDFNGLEEQTTVQVLSAREQANKFDFTALEWRYANLLAGETEDLSDIVYFQESEEDVTSLYDLFTALWPTPTDTTVCTFVVEAGVTISSSSTSIPAMDTDTGWPAFTTGKIVIQLEAGAKIVGKGGTGGTLAVGTAGGDAINLQEDVTIINNGIIGGGGGGGGDAYTSADNTAGGGGGAGFGDRGATLDDTGWDVIRVSADGTSTSRGIGGGLEESAGAEPDNLFGGRGGDLGEAGQTGVKTGAGTTTAGGSAGKAVDLNANVLTYETRGDIRGDDTT